MNARNASNRLDYGSFFEAWEIRLTKGLVRQFSGPGKAFDSNESEYLVHQCLCHWYFKHKKPGNKTVDDIQAYMRTVVRNRLRDLIRAQKTRGRRVLNEADSLDAMLSEEADGKTRRRAQDALTVSVEPHDLRMDFSLVFQGLRDDQKELIELLGQGLSIREAAKVLGKHHSTISDRVKRIRAVFASAGLKDYFD